MKKNCIQKALHILDLRGLMNALGKSRSKINNTWFPLKKSILRHITVILFGLVWFAELPEIHMALIAEFIVQRIMNLPQTIW